MAKISRRDPEILLIIKREFIWKYFFNMFIPLDKVNHHKQDPEITPRTIMAGAANLCTSAPRPEAAKMARKTTIVIGLVRVKKKVET